MRANSKAVLRPIPDDAPVMTTVLPARRFAVAEDIVRAAIAAAEERPGGKVRGWLKGVRNRLDVGLVVSARRVW